MGLPELAAVVRAQRQESSEKQAAKARQTERAIERLEVVEEPRKEWELRMEIASAPRSGSVVARADAAKRPAWLEDSIKRQRAGIHHTIHQPVERENYN